VTELFVSDKRAAGASPASRREGGLMTALSARQTQIMEYLDLGCTNQEISRFLGISVNTVKTHVAALLKLLDAGNRTEAVHRYRQMGTAGRTEPAKPPCRGMAMVGIVPFEVAQECPELSGTALALEEVVCQRLLGSRRFAVAGTDGAKAVSGPGRRGFDYSLAASLRRGERGLRLDVRLFSFGDRQIRWAQGFEVPEVLGFADVDTASAQIVATLQWELESLEVTRIAALPPEDGNAWELALRGVHLLERNDRVSHEQAMDLFARAVAMDNGLLLGHHGMALGYGVSLMEHWVEDADWVRANVHVHAAACSVLEPDSPDTLLVQAVSKLVDGNLALAASLLRETVRRNPCGVLGYSLLGQVHALSGDDKEALRCHREAAHLCTHIPARLHAHGTCALIEFLRGDFRAVAVACREGIAYGAMGALSQLLLVAACSRLGDADGLKAAWSALRASRPGFRLQALDGWLASVVAEPAARFREVLRLPELQTLAHS